MPAKPPEENAPRPERNFPDGYQYGIHDVGYVEPTDKEAAKAEKQAEKDQKELATAKSTLTPVSQTTAPAQAQAEEDGAATPKEKSNEGGK